MCSPLCSAEDNQGVYHEAICIPHSCDLTCNFCKGCTVTPLEMLRSAIITQPDPAQTCNEHTPRGLHPPITNSSLNPTRPVQLFSHISHVSSEHLFCEDRWCGVRLLTGRLRRHAIFYERRVRLGQKSIITSPWQEIPTPFLPGKVVR